MRFGRGRSRDAECSCLRPVTLYFYRIARAFGVWGRVAAARKSRYCQLVVPGRHAPCQGGRCIRGANPRDHDFEISAWHISAFEVPAEASGPFQAK